jgi:hypothetical protein
MKSTAIKGIYTDWTAPFFEGFRNSSDLKQINRDDYKNMILLLSTLKWKQHNGPTILYTDKVGYEYYASLKMLSIWDEVNTAVLESIDKNKFSPRIYWSYAKLITTKIEIRQSIQIDTDLICWSSIVDKINNSKVLTLHPEPLSKKDFRDYYEKRPITRAGYKFKKEWNWNSDPVNTALLYIKDQTFMDYWFSEVERFAAYNDKTYIPDESRTMIFADQQLLALCMAEWNIKPSFIIDDIDNCSNNKEITHLWLYKLALDNDLNLKLNFTKRLANRIVEEFPYYQKLDWIQRYLP